MKTEVIGWSIDQADRNEALNRFPPKYANVVADHVTFGIKDESPPLPKIRAASIVGYAHDESGVEALVIQIQGTTDRPTGGTYHSTWSLGEDRVALESNDVIAEYGWEPLSEPLTVKLTPTQWTRDD